MHEVCTSLTDMTWWFRCYIRKYFSCSDELVVGGAIVFKLCAILESCLLCLAHPKWPMNETFKYNCGVYLCTCGLTEGVYWWYAVASEHWKLCVLTHSLYWYEVATEHNAIKSSYVWKQACVCNNITHELPTTVVRIVDCLILFKWYCVLLYWWLMRSYSWKEILVQLLHRWNFINIEISSVYLCQHVCWGEIFVLLLHG